MRAGLRLGSGGPRFSERVKPPLTLGEHRVIQFSIGVRTLIRARLLGEGGRPIVNSRFVARFLGTGTSPEAETYRTDGEGRCVFLVEGSAGSAPVSLNIQVRSLRGVTLAVREVELAGLPRGGLLYLGDIRMQDTELLAAGQVVDAAGDPVRDARVVVEVQVGEDGAWSARSALDARTSLRGSFVVRGVSASRQLRLVARMIGHAASAPVLCQPGESQVILALRRLGSLSASFEWSGGDPQQLLTLRLERAGEDSALGARGWGRFESLRPGPYDLAITVRGTQQPLLELLSLEVPFGGPCTDSRLHPIRLDGLLEVVRLTVVDSEGSPIPDASARVTDPPRALRLSGTWRADKEDGGRITIPASLRQPLTVSAPGCRALEIAPPLGDESVTLRWSHSVVLRLPAQLEQDFDGWLVLISPPPPPVQSFVSGSATYSLTFGELRHWRLVLPPGAIDGHVIHPPDSFLATWFDQDPDTSREATSLGGADYPAPQAEGALEIVLPMPQR